GAPARGVYLKWLFFGPSVFEPAMTDRAFPRKEAPRAIAVGWRDFDQVLDVLSGAIGKGPWLMGEQFTAADVTIGSSLRYGMAFKLVPERPEFVSYVARIAERPAAQRAKAKDQAFAGD
ncbi:MAG: glutathione binding-like protein, partial [Pseudolabrys sp.]